MTEWVRCTKPDCFYKLRHCHPANPPPKPPRARSVSQEQWKRLTADLHDPVPIFRRIAEMARDGRCELRGDIAAVAEAAADLFRKD